jgi:catechol 1,2-dioxygenase
MVSAPGYKQVVTQIYPNDDPHLEDDAVFAVKGDLVVNFADLKGDPKASKELLFDFSLAPKAQTNGH